MKDIPKPDRYTRKKQLESTEQTETEDLGTSSLRPFATTKFPIPQIEFHLQNRWLYSSCVPIHSQRKTLPENFPTAR